MGIGIREQGKRATGLRPTVLGGDQGQQDWWGKYNAAHWNRKEIVLSSDLDSFCQKSDPKSDPTQNLLHSFGFVEK